MRRGEASLRRLVLYAVRWLGALLRLEAMLHYWSVCCVTDQRRRFFERFSFIEACLVIYFVMQAIWLKFLVIWRFFRLWALCDGVVPPENMGRCVNNHYSVVGFWRSWHRSFNRWLLRYVYIPLGGSRNVSTPRRILNTFCVFTFVAFWHDRTMQLLVWGWFIALVFVPELVLRRCVPAAWRRRPWYRAAKACACAVNIALMMIGNLIGYSVGIQGTLNVLHDLLTWQGAAWLAVILVSFFCAAQLMFEVRCSEAKRAAMASAQLAKAATASSSSFSPAAAAAAAAAELQQRP
jgi:D-alanyl-lipoteichoic acid acyltransferase DltB (MBOAT superfamily)